jgi:hypothetical protein
MKLIRTGPVAVSLAERARTIPAIRERLMIPDNHRDRPRDTPETTRGHRAPQKRRHRFHVLDRS